MASRKAKSKVKKKPITTRKADRKKSTKKTAKKACASSQLPHAVLERELTVTELLSVTHAQLLGIERIIVTDVHHRLSILAGDGKLDRKQYRDEHDAAFSAFNNFVGPIWKLQMHWRGVRLWLRDGVGAAGTHLRTDVYFDQAVVILVRPVRGQPPHHGWL